MQTWEARSCLVHHLLVRRVKAHGEPDRRRPRHRDRHLCVCCNAVRRYRYNTLQYETIQSLENPEYPEYRGKQRTSPDALVEMSPAMMPSHVLTLPHCGTETQLPSPHAAAQPCMRSVYRPLPLASPHALQAVAKD
jgi:hypothetical protein